MASFGVVALSVATLVMYFGSIPLHAWTFTLLWAWFVLPIFPSLPTVSLASALGLTFFIGVCIRGYRKEPESEKKERGSEARAWQLAEDAFASICRPLAAAGVGYLLHLWIGGAA